MHREPLNTTVSKCRRCGGKHSNITLTPFKNDDDSAYISFTHYAMCPTNGEPMLMRVESY